MKLIEKLASEGHFTPEQLDRIGRNVQSFMAAVDRDPTFFKAAMEKVAGGWGDIGEIFSNAFSKENLGKGVERAVNFAPQAAVLAGTGALMGGAVEVGRSSIRSMRESLDKSRAYQEMMEENPALANANPNVTEKAFNTLYRFNPAYAKDPMVAGTFVKNVLDQERLDIGQISNLVQSHKLIQESKPKDRTMDTFMNAMMGAPDPEEQRHRALMQEKEVNRADAEEGRLRAQTEKEEAERDWWRANYGTSSTYPGSNP